MQPAGLTPAILQIKRHGFPLHVVSLNGIRASPVKASLLVLFR